MSSREAIEQLADRIDSIIDGSASHEEAMAAALVVVGIVSWPTQALSEFCSCRGDYSDTDTIFEASTFGRSVARGIAAAMAPHYEYAASVIMAVVTASQYADATLVPCAVVSRAGKHGTEVKTYVVYNPISGLIKIGRSKDVASRVRSLETGAGSRLTILAVFDCDREAELHSMFASIRQHGEWFGDDGSIREFVRGSA